jgi:serine/threonine-protein kinase
MQIITNPLPVPSHFAPVPPGFDAFWARAAARDPDARYQTAKELAEALAEALDCPVDETRRIGSRSSFADALTADLPRPSLTMGASPTLAASPLELAASPPRPASRRATASSMAMAIAALLVLGSGAIAAIAWRGRAPDAAATAPGDAVPPRVPAAGAPSLATIPAQDPTVEPSITTQPIPSASAVTVASAAASARPPVRAKTARPASSPTSRPRYDDGI